MKRIVSIALLMLVYLQVNATSIDSTNIQKSKSSYGLGYVHCSQQKLDGVHFIISKVDKNDLWLQVGLTVNLFDGINSISNNRAVFYYDGVYTDRLGVNFSIGKIFNINKRWKLLLGGKLMYSTFHESHGTLINSSINQRETYEANKFMYYQAYINAMMLYTISDKLSLNFSYSPGIAFVKKKELIQNRSFAGIVKEMSLLEVILARKIK